MSDNIYTSYWQTILPSVINQFESGNKIIYEEVENLKNYGERQSYYSNFRIVNGVLDIPKNAYAQGRDLYNAFVETEYFKNNLSNSTIQVTITKDLRLKMEVLAANAPDFFTEKDFEALTRFVRQTKIQNNEEHQNTYDFLKTTYTKTEYWAKQVQQKIFSGGLIHIIQKPTNQANKFEYYHWAKIYPDKASYDYKALAFTVGIEANEFTIKIDTIALSDSDSRRQTYLKLRNSSDNSSVIKQLSAKQVLDKGWKYLIDLSANILTTLKPTFDFLLNSFKGVVNAPIIQKINKKRAMNTALNTILYGPPGTGKTYELLALTSEFTITTNIQNIDAFLEEKISELTWFTIIAAALFELGQSSVPALEKHRFIKIKARQSGTKHLAQMIWSNLQAHTDPTSSYVLTARRVGPFVFSKTENSIWTILKERVENDAPDVIEFLNSVKDFQPSPKSIQKNYKMVTFHQSFTYEDFVEGIKPVMQDDITDDLQYEISKGIFYMACNEAAKLAGYDNLSACIGDNTESRKNKFTNAPVYGLFIDEINRANVSSVFGELITLIEDDKRLGKENEIIDITLPYSKNKFGVPANLFLIGTMNTADRSIEALDTALRRRFVFNAMESDPSLISPYYLMQRLWMKHWSAEPDTKEWQVWDEDERQLIELSGMQIDRPKYIELSHRFEHPDKEKEWLESDPVKLFSGIISFDNGIDLSKMLTKINSRLEAFLSKDHTIGHAWLMNVYSLKDLQLVFKNKILPLLQEYFYNNYAKIGLVLGNKFVDQTPVKDVFAKFNNAEEITADFENNIRYTLNDVMTLDAEAFKSIYQ